MMSRRALKASFVERDKENALVVGRCRAPKPAEQPRPRTERQAGPAPEAIFHNGVRCCCERKREMAEIRKNREGVLECLLLQWPMMQDQARVARRRQVSAQMLGVRYSSRWGRWWITKKAGTLVGAVPTSGKERQKAERTHLRTGFCRLNLSRSPHFCSPLDRSRLLDRWRISAEPDGEQLMRTRGPRRGRPQRGRPQRGRRR